MLHFFYSFWRSEKLAIVFYFCLVFTNQISQKSLQTHQNYLYPQIWNALINCLNLLCIFFIQDSAFFIIISL